MPQRGVDPDIRQAWTLPASFYTSPDLFAASKEAVFAPSWQWIGDVELCRVPGQCHPFTLLEGMVDEPLLFTRDRDDRLHCLSNVCTHRGTLVCEGSGVVNHLRCRYHGRRFGLDGKFQHMPEFEGVEGFPAESDNLAHAPFGVWRKWLFASCGPHQPLAEFLAEVDRRVGWMPLETFKADEGGVRDFLVRCHWALYVDNYLEGFHIPYVHSSLNAVLDYGSYRSELFEGSNLQVGLASGAEECFDLPAGHPDAGQRVAAYYFWLYPNLMLNFYPWGLSVNVVRPLGQDRTKVTFYPFVWDESKRSQGAGSGLDRVEREDEAVVEMVNRGMKSRFYSRGRFSPEREKGVHQFHRMLARDLLSEG